MPGKSGRGPTQRQLRIGEELRHALVAILARGDLHDPAVAGHSITVTEVRVGNDLRTATAFVMPLGGEDTDNVVEGLNRASPAIRHQLAGMLRLRFLPRLSFRRDQSFDEARRIDTLLRDPVVARDLNSRDLDPSDPDPRDTDPTED